MSVSLWQSQQKAKLQGIFVHVKVHCRGRIPHHISCAFQLPPTCVTLKTSKESAGADPGFFFRSGCTRLLLYFNTNKPHSFFFCRTPVVLENRRSSQGEGVRTPCTLPLDLPLALHVQFGIYSVGIC